MRITAPPTDSLARPGEVALTVNPAQADDAGLAFIGSVSSPWRSRLECPKNLREARERETTAEVRIDMPFRPALSGLKSGDWIFLLTWLHEAGRNLALQQPRHADRPRGTFSLRSPVRPNPIGLHLVQIRSISLETGHLSIDAIDVLDGTPLLDIKPYLPSVDSPPQLPEDFR